MDGDARVDVMGAGERMLGLGVDSELLCLLRAPPLSLPLALLPPRLMSPRVGALDAAVPVAMRKPGGGLDSRNFIDALRKRPVVELLSLLLSTGGEAETCRAVGTASGNLSIASDGGEVGVPEPAGEVESAIAYEKGRFWAMLV